MIFHGWHGLLRVAVAGVLGYAALVLVLRISGKRTLSKMNAFDLVVTVALGSTLATVVLSRDVAVLEGVTAFIVLVGGQYIVAWASVRSSLVRRVVKSQPALVYYRGRFLDESLRRERLTEGEILAAVRAQGIASMEEVHAVVLETAGDISILRERPGPATTLSGVAGGGPDGE